MIHIVFVLHDMHGNYGKYNAIAMTSVFENTKEDITIHFIHDATLTNEQKIKFNNLCVRYGKKIYFYQIETESCFYHELYSKGTFFRLYIPQLLSQKIKKVIYLDTDICVHMDINDLWKIDVEKHAIAAVKDDNVHHDYWMCETFDESYQQSFNAGILVMNLEIIRAKYDLVKSTARFLCEYPQVRTADQDALNYIFHFDCLFIEKRFNYFGDVDTPAVLGNIYHFAGVYKPWKTYFTHLSGVYWDYFVKSEWGTSAFITGFHLQMQQKTNWLIHFYQTVYNGKKIILFGAGDTGAKMLSRVHIDPKRDYYVDNNSLRWNEKFMGIPIYSPQKIFGENIETIVIILCVLECQAIKNLLEANSLQEDIDFFDGRKLLEIEGGGSFWGK